MDSSDIAALIAKREKDRKKEAKIAAEKRAMAASLLASGRPYREVAEALGISVGSVHNIMRESSKDITRLLKETRARIAMKCLLLSDHILGRISDHDIIYASLREKIIASAILADKAAKLEKMTASPDKAPQNETLHPDPLPAGEGAEDEGTEGPQVERV